MTRVPVRRGHGPLHLAVSTGRGYRTECGRVLTGPNLEVPMPRLALGRGHLERHWAKCWAYDRVCRSCRRASLTL